MSENLNTNGSISRYRIVELCDTHGVLGSRILAGLGAEVIKVEPPADGSIRPNDMMMWMQSFATERVNRGGNKMEALGIRIVGSIYLASSKGNITLKSNDPDDQP